MDDHYCKNCGTLLKKESKFCKECGASKELSLFKRINKKINIFGAFLGMSISFIISFIVMFLIYPQIYTDISFQALLFIFLSIVMFFSGFFTSLFCCDEYDEGIFNALFLFLFSVLNLAFISMMTFILSLSIISAFTSVFKNTDTSKADLYQNIDTNNGISSSSESMEILKPLLEILLGIILMLSAGLIGGCLGVAIKKLFK
ncbi:MAG: zinc ribbon domain-containing protein [Methanobacteriaceae archaeon]|nr:zinc ribbon domain-containing protein [Methanobacteriaceae archaeon]